MDPAASPCGKSFNGYKQCNGKQFVTFYAGALRAPVELPVPAGDWEGDCLFCTMHGCHHLAVAGQPCCLSIRLSVPYAYDAVWYTSAPSDLDPLEPSLPPPLPLLLPGPAGIVSDACRVSSDLITNGVVIPAPVATPSLGGRKMLQSSIIIKNPTTISSSGAVASSIQKVPVPAGAQVILPGQPALVPGPQIVVPGGPQVIVPGTSVPQQVVIQGQVQPVLLPGQPTGLIYPGQAVVVPGQPQVIYPAGH